MSQLACISAGKHDTDTNRWECNVTGEECFYLIPNSKACAEEFNEGPDATADDEEEGEAHALCWD